MLRSAPRKRCGALLIRGPSVDPGSAKQRYTLHRVRDTSLDLTRFSACEVICPSCHFVAGISLVTSGKSPLEARPSRTHQEGRLADRHERWARDAMDACGARDECAVSGRRSRVVLTPRRWRQAGGDDPPAMVAIKPGSPGRARRKPLKPFAQGMPDCFGEPVVTTLVCFFHSHTRLRVRLKHLAFPAPSVFRKAKMCWQNSGAIRVAGMRRRGCLKCESEGRRFFPSPLAGEGGAGEDRAG